MPSISELLKNLSVQIALGIVALMAVGSITYYLIESAPPKVTYAAVTKGDITEDVTATGTVTPVQNPTLSFEVGGQVRTVYATVGEKVSQGTLLASLDTGVLSASLAAAEAQLNQLEAGPRAVDVAGQQTGVASAQQNLNTTLTTLPSTLQTTYAKAESAVTTQADPLFNLSYHDNPTLTFTTVTQSDEFTADSDRAQLYQLFPEWQAELSAATSSPSTAQLQNLTSESIANLTQVQTFFQDLIAALNDAQVAPTPAAQAQQIANLTSANAGLATVNGLITTLQTEQQTITSQQLAVQSAQDQLTDTQAGATPQAIAAQQAAVAGIEAQISQQEIVAPFSGTVASVSVKPGDTATPGSSAISLIPNGTFEVDVYLAENDMTKVKVGDATDITLDAYGTGRVFPATVASIDTSPSTNPMDSTQTGYKVVLIFNQADPAIANGMSASVTIHAGSADNTLIIPSSAVISEGTQSYVLKQTSAGPVKTLVTLGLSNDTEVQVLTGLSAGDEVSAVGSQD